MISSSFLNCWFFFFQAEDGIRDLTVTGVQTCALPISAKDDTLPPTAFRAPNTPSLAFDAGTGSLTFLYQNNINRPVSKADISFQRSTDGEIGRASCRERV